MAKKYRFNWRYISSYGGPWEEGEVVELDDELAEALGRDSPGVLGEVKARALEAPPQDRQVKAAQTRRLDRQGDPSDQGAITKADYKAVKGK